VEDQRDWLLALGFGRRKTATAPPAQATIYRFIWALEQQAVALQLWARDALQALGQHQEAGLLEVSLDGQHLKGSAGDKAIVLVFAYLSRLQSKAAGDEAAAGRGLMMGVGAALAELKDWATHLLQYPPDDVCYHQVCSGALWVWRVRTT